MRACFTPKIIADKLERADRFIEEALELAQATGYCGKRAHALVDYVFNRPVGEPFQEVGGVMVTLAALCNYHGLDMEDAAETELARVWTKIDKIRAKQASKPVGSALPIPLSSPRSSTVDEATVGWQPIETAPKDGRYLIVAKFSEAPDQPVLGWVKHSRWITTDEIADLEGGDPSDYDAGWTDGNDDSEPCYPTHWQPLEPPASLPSVAVQPK
jgi:NTP pyrophosphatase (non-canonical NTP hydrolase)